MSIIKWLALLPYAGMLIGIGFVNRTTPYILGMPLPLAWIVGWVVASAVIMTVIYRLDPANRADAPGGERLP